MPTYARERSRTKSTSKVSGIQVVGKKYAYDQNIGRYQSSPIQTMNWEADLPWTDGEFTGDEIHPGPPFRTGGPFRNVKVTRVTPYGIQGYGTYNCEPPNWAPWQWRRYVGGFHPPSDQIFGGPSVSNTSVLNGDSTLFPGISVHDCDRAWKFSKPRIEHANLFVTLAELRDLPRMLQGSAKHFESVWNDILRGRIPDPNRPGYLMPSRGRGQFNTPDQIPDIFLNQEFGWRPFLADIRKMTDLVFQAERIIKNLMDRNGKPVRRKITILGDQIIDEEGAKKIPNERRKPTISVPRLTSDKVISINNGLCCLPVSLEGGFFTTPPTYEVSEQVTDHITATSCWTYYNSVFDAGLEGWDSSLTSVRRYLTVFGGRITPSNVYRAMPWTWLVDWFSNFGDLVDRMSEAMTDEVVCKYLYVTRVHTLKRVVTQLLPFRDPGNLVLKWEKIILTKERKSASSSFGFSLSESALTPRQLLILGALGWK